MEEECCRQCEKVNKSHTSAPMELKVGGGGGGKSKRAEMEENKTSDEYGKQNNFFHICLL